MSCRFRWNSSGSVVTDTGPTSAHQQSNTPRIYTENIGFQFVLFVLLSRNAMLTRDIDIGFLSVRLSVRPFLTLWYCIETM